MARAAGKGSSKKKTRGRKGKSPSAITGRYVTKSHAQRSPKTSVKESKASKFADSFIERHPDTFHELSKR